MKFRSYLYGNNNRINTSLHTSSSAILISPSSLIVLVTIIITTTVVLLSTDSSSSCSYLTVSFAFATNDNLFIRGISNSNRYYSNIIHNNKQQVLLQPMCISSKQKQLQQQRQSHVTNSIRRGGGGGSRSSHRIAQHLSTVPTSSSSDSTITSNMEQQVQEQQALVKQFNDTFVRTNASTSLSSSTTSSAIMAMTNTVRQRYRSLVSDPRIMACIYMSISMSLHYSGYEFVRNVALSLFTSNIGFPQPMAYPLMNGLISPISVVLLYYYSQQMDVYGPRLTLYHFTKSCVGFIILSSLTLWQCSIWTTETSIASSTILPLLLQQVQRAMIGLLFIFNNCYVFMISSQQWSFIDSIVTPNEGAKYFGILTGVCSILCSITSGIIPYVSPYCGLIGMYSISAITLYGTLRTGDYAYHIAQKNGFDPALQQEKNKKKKQQQKEQLRMEQAARGIDMNSTNNNNRIGDAIALFQRVPTLRALLLEGVSFQSLGTILNVAMIRALKIAMPNDDIGRSAYTGRFYSLISGISAIVQFILLPICMKRFESKHLWRFLPILPIIVTLYQIVPFSTIITTTTISPLTMVAMALFITKIIDYSIRVVIYNMTYQPLDFESRFIGKEIINVLGGRVGRSGMSLLLSAYTALFATTITSGIQPLSYFAFTASTIWGMSAYWLSTLIPSKADAQRTVVERQQQIKLEQQQEDEQSKRKPKIN